MAATEQLTVLFESAFDAPRKSGENRLEDVALLGPVSKNGYRYDCFTRENASLYEEASVYLNHGKGPDGRTIREWVGTIGDATPHPNEKRFRGTIKFLEAVKDDPDVRKVREAAEKGLKNVGMSHVVSIDEVKHKRTTREGTTIVGLKKVHSVDIVMNPATTSGLFEDDHSMSNTNKTAKDILLGFCRFDREKTLVEALGDVTAVEVVGLKPDATTQEQVTAAFEAVGAKVWNDDGKRAEVLKAKKALLEGVVDVKEDKQGKGESKPGDVLTYQEAHKLCDEQKVTAGSSLLESLTGLAPLKAKVIVEQFVAKDTEIARLTKLNEAYSKAAGKTTAPGVTISKGVTHPGDQPGQGDDLPAEKTEEAAKARAKWRREQLASQN